MRATLLMVSLATTVLLSGCERGANCRVFVLNGIGQDATLTSPEAGVVEIPSGHRVLLRPTADIDVIDTPSARFTYPSTVVDANVCLRSAEYGVLFLEVEPSGTIRILPKTPVAGSDFPVAPASVKSK